MRLEVPQISVSGGRRKDSLERPLPAVLIDRLDEYPDVVWSQEINDGAHHRLHRYITVCLDSGYDD